MLTPLSEAADADRFGGKAAALARALNAGLPVPNGFALDVEAVEAFVTDDTLALSELAPCAESTCWERWAVRSSALGEDGTSASFAGQHLTRLGIRGARALLEAVRDVHASVFSPAARAYRTRQGIAGPPQTGVILQRLIFADVAGVLFTKNPLTHTDELLIEASWGLGEVVVSSLVTPDRFRIARSGQVLERTLGEKEVRLVLSAETLEQTETTPEERAMCCLDDAQLGTLHALSDALDRIWSGPHDVEFAFFGDRLFVLQRRPLTTG